MCYVCDVVWVSITPRIFRLTPYVRGLCILCFIPSSLPASCWNDCSWSIEPFYLYLTLPTRNEAFSAYLLCMCVCPELFLCRCRLCRCLFVIVFCCVGLSLSLNVWVAFVVFGEKASACFKVITDSRGSGKWVEYCSTRVFSDYSRLSVSVCVYSCSNVYSNMN